jgi:hypothetical protein
MTKISSKKDAKKTVKKNPKKEAKKVSHRMPFFNTTEVIHKDIILPCKKCGYCPYGFLVEEFKLSDEKNKHACGYFGHECPVWYLAERLKK